MKLQCEKMHRYYTQVQMSLYVLGMAKCHFYVYSSAQDIVIEVPFDRELVSEPIARLEHFYFVQFLSRLAQVKCK